MPTSARPTAGSDPEPRGFAGAYVGPSSNGEDGPATIRVTDLNFAEVCEIYEDYGS